MDNPRLPFENVISQLSSLGYDGVELVTEDISSSKRQELRRIVGSYNLEIVAIPSALVRERYGLTFTDPSVEKRNAAVAKFNEFTSFARKIGASIVTIGLVRGWPGSTMAPDKAWDSMVSCINSCGKHAEEEGITLAIEPETRYEVGWIHTVAEALQMAEEVSLESVKLMIDTFHMNIEEESMVEPIRKAAKQLVHVHVADSNRCAPGMGHIEFAEIIQTLKSCGYHGYLGFEISPNPDPLVAAEKSIQYVKRLL